MGTAARRCSRRVGAAEGRGAALLCCLGGPGLVAGGVQWWDQKPDGGDNSEVLALSGGRSPGTRCAEDVRDRRESSLWREGAEDAGRGLELRQEEVYRVL